MLANSRMLPILSEAYGQQPLLFVPNRGQAEANVSFIAEKLGYYVGVSAWEVSMALCRRNERRAGFHLAWKFIGSNNEATVEGLDQEPGFYHYFMESFLAPHCTNLPSYRKVVFRSLWPNIDAVLQEKDQAPRLEWIVHPGGRPDHIRFACEGCSSIRLDREGHLLIDTELGLLTDSRPNAYQPHAEHIVPIPCFYKLVSQRDGSIVICFELPEGFDSCRELYIGSDPTCLTNLE
ncbi:hypothetical protein D7Z26_22700 [Cohnella endophytica]|uniref:DUF7948 domain-containing protein n=1 Tax=Cohnella endophytica TaxID=2419778 RepID=A0A494XKE3_9BACL|nr:hypothetical protein [Cohnella endophytica]RKP48013.1 hypothetical protein D7Z26_22700 [Cohnella endophytica]